MEVQVKHGAKTHSVRLANEECKGKDLQEELQSLTGCFARQQKLIFKGKVVDAAKSLASQGITPGSKLMMLASAQASSQAPDSALTKGQQLARSQSQQRASDAQARLAQAFAAAKGQAAPSTAAAAAASGGGATVGVGLHGGIGSIAERRRNWARTAMVALRDQQLFELPDDIFEGLSQEQQQQQQQTQPQQQQQPQQHHAQSQAPEESHAQQSLHQHHTGEPQHPQHADGTPAPSTSTRSLTNGAGPAAPPAAREQHQASTAGSSWHIRVVDCSHNLLHRLPSVSALTGLTTLRLSCNRLGDDGMPWGALADACAGSLAVLELDANGLTALPGAHVCRLTALQRLSARDNQISSIPEEIGALQGLQVLLLDRNQLRSICPALGSCCKLQELSATQNQIHSIPEELASCSELQALKLSRNMISSVSPALLSHQCPSFWLLELNANPITADQLRSTPNYPLFDERRRAKADKQLEGGVLLDSSRAFSEGADSREWERWRSAQ